MRISNRSSICWLVAVGNWITIKPQLGTVNVGVRNSSRWSLQCVCVEVHINVRWDLCDGGCLQAARLFNSILVGRWLSALGGMTECWRWQDEGRRDLRGGLTTQLLTHNTHTHTKNPAHRHNAFIMAFLLPYLGGRWWGRTQLGKSEQTVHSLGSCLGNSEASLDLPASHWHQIEKQSQQSYT